MDAVQLGAHRARRLAPRPAAVPLMVIYNFVSGQRRAWRLSRWPTWRPKATWNRPLNNHWDTADFAEAARTLVAGSLDVYGDGPLRGDLLRQATALGLDGRARFLAGRTRRRQLSCLATWPTCTL